MQQSKHDRKKGAMIGGVEVTWTDPPGTVQDKTIQGVGDTGITLWSPVPEVPSA